MKKRIIVITLVLSSALLFCTGCSNNEWNDIAENELVPTVEQTTPTVTNGETTTSNKSPEPYEQHIFSGTDTVDGVAADNIPEEENIATTNNDANKEPEPEPSVNDFVCVTDYIPDIIVELRYVTADNFTGQVIYPFDTAYLRYGTVKKLVIAQAALRDLGYRLKIWDAFRPVSAQYKLWEVYPVDAYVANPNKHYSSHNRGNTVDITLVAMDGSEIEMPTDFDNFTQLADRDYSDCSEEARKNATVLETEMCKAGFNPYKAEWWHFSDVDEYPVDTDFVPLS